MNIGSVRMTERHLTNDPPTQTQIDEPLWTSMNISMSFRTVDAGKARTIIGVSGTVTTMTALAMGLKEYDHTVVDGHRLSLEDAYAVDDKFLRMTRAERREYKTIHPRPYRCGRRRRCGLEPCAGACQRSRQGRSW